MSQPGRTAAVCSLMTVCRGVHHRGTENTEKRGTMQRAEGKRQSKDLTTSAADYA